MSRRSRRILNSQRRRYLTIVAALSLLSFLLLFSTIILAFFRNDEAKTMALISEEKESMQQQIDSITKKATDAENNLKRVSSEKLPGLRDYVFDKQIPINSPYLEFISFESVNLERGRQINFQCRLGLRNSNELPASLIVTILYFSKSGEFIGSTIFGGGKKEGQNNEVLPSLKSKEKRTYISGVITLEGINEPPSYFHVVTVDKNDTKTRTFTDDESIQPR